MTFFLLQGVAIFANLANLRRLLELSRIDMLIMSYGGLRGALAFALALVLDDQITARKKEFVTAAIVVILFTVFVQVIGQRSSNGILNQLMIFHLGYNARSFGKITQCTTKTNGRTNDECDINQSSNFDDERYVHCHQLISFR